MRTAMTKPMNKVEKLIEELCPKGMAFRGSEEVYKFFNGKI